MPNHYQGCQGVAERLRYAQLTKPACAEWIRSSRIRRGLSQTELATKLGTSQTNVSFWECAKTRPRLPYLRALQELFGTRHP